MLEEMATSNPIFTHLWVENTGQPSSFIDENIHILEDDMKKKENSINMFSSLASENKGLSCKYGSYENFLSY
jgi:hypothetical protein